MSDKKGLDAELAQKRASKYDPKAEQEAIQWIEAVTGLRVGPDLFSGLRNGVILCHLVNKIQPGICPKFVLNPKHYLEEKANINKYLDACVRFGVPSQDLFTELDLSESRRDLTVVLQNIYAVARQAQAHGFDGPRLGVRYYKSVEDQKRLEERRERERMEEARRHAKYEEERRIRRDELEKESEKKHENKTESTKKRGLERRKSRELRGRRLKPFIENIDLTGETNNTPIKFGMDAESQAKVANKYNFPLERSILYWLEDITGEELDYFWGCLKSGRILCTAVNKIQPGTIAKVNRPGIPLHERDNIASFIRACIQFGVAQHDLFNVNDLYNAQDLNSVMLTIDAFSRAVERRSHYKGPLLKNYFKEIPETDVEIILPPEPKIPPPIIIPEEPSKSVSIKDTHPLIGTKQPLWRRWELRGYRALLFYIICLFICGGGPYEMFSQTGYKQLFEQKTNIFNSVCMNGTNVDVECRVDHIETMGIVTSGILFVVMFIAGILFDKIGPKMTACLGFAVKIAGCILLAFSSEHFNVDYAGFALFRLGGSFVLVSSFQVSTDLSHISPAAAMALLTLLGAVWISGGGWISQIVWLLSDNLGVSVMWIFVGFAIILSILALLSVVLWPTHKGTLREGYIPISGYLKTDAESQLMETTTNRFKGIFTIHLLTLGLFIALTITTASYYIHIIPYFHITDLLYHSIITKLIPSIAILSIPLAYLSTRVHALTPMVAIIILSIVSLGLLMVNSIPANYVAASSVGIFPALAIGFWGAAIIRNNSWEFFGTAFGLVGILVGGLHFVMLLDKEPFENSFYVIIGVITGIAIFIVYPAVVVAIQLVRGRNGIQKL